MKERKKKRVIREAAWMDLVFVNLGNTDGYITVDDDDEGWLIVLHNKFEGDLDRTLDGIIALIEGQKAAASRKRLNYQGIFLHNRSGLAYLLIRLMYPVTL